MARSALISSNQVTDSDLHRAFEHITSQSRLLNPLHTPRIARSSIACLGRCSGPEDRHRRTSTRPLSCDSDCLWTASPSAVSTHCTSLGSATAASSSARALLHRHRPFHPVILSHLIDARGSLALEPEEQDQEIGCTVDQKARSGFWARAVEVLERAPLSLDSGIRQQRHPLACTMGSRLLGGTLRRKTRL